MEKLGRFKPGSEVHDLGIVREARLELPEISLQFPSRIHMTPIDCNRFAFGKPGGGGIGYAVDLPNQLRIARSQRMVVVANRRADVPLVTHYWRVMQRVLKMETEFDFHLDLMETVRQHFGLGSSVSVACAVLFGLNRIFGSPLSIDEMRELIAYNFVEELDGEVSRGLETGVGTSVVFRGGMAVVANELVEIFRRPFPEGYSIVLVDPRTSRPGANKPESEEMLRRTFFLDSSYRYTKAYDVLMDIIPALHAGDLKRVGNYIWDIQYSGTHLSMIQSYEDFGRRIYETLGVLRRGGADVCGLSSVGPAIYAVCHHDMKDALMESCVELPEGASVSEVNPNNDGIRVLQHR